MGLNWRNNQNFDYVSPKFSYFDEVYTNKYGCMNDFIKISIKSTRKINNTN